MKLLIIFIYLIIANFSFASEKPDIKNLVLIKNLKKYEDVIFEDINQKIINLDDFKEKLILLNFSNIIIKVVFEKIFMLNNINSYIQL